MRLNGGAFNAQVVNGSRRAPVYASAVAAAGFFADGEGRVEVRGEGAAHCTVGGALTPRALRQAQGHEIRVDLEALGTGARRRVGVGEGVNLTLSVSPLPYQVWRRGFGAATIAFDGVLTPRAYRAPDASSLINLRAEVLLSAQRFAPLVAEVGTHLTVTPSVYRVAATRRGFGGLGLLASLFYSRTQYGGGSALLNLTARADVGVEFLEGAGVMLPMHLGLSSSRRRWSSGVAPLVTRGDFSASAIRRLAAAPRFELRTLAELDSVHITATGVRYVTPALHAPISVHALDGGLQRRLTAGGFSPVDLSLSAVGSLRRGRTIAAGQMATSLLAHVEFISTRPFPPSPLVLSLGAEGAGDVFVRGGGDAAIALDATLDGRSARYIDGDAAVEVISGTLTPLIYRGGRGTITSVSTLVDLIGTRRRVGQGALSLVAEAQTAELLVFRRGQGAWVAELEARGQGESFVYGGGSASLVLDPQFTGQVSRLVAGEGVVALSCEGRGDVFVRGAGRCVTTLGADFTVIRTQFLEVEGVSLVVECEGAWSVPARVHLGTVLTTLDLELERVRWARDLPALVKTIDADCAGWRRAVLHADAEIEVLGSSTAYINIFSDDVDTQTFVRSADMRAFLRTADTRLFQRVS